MTSAATELPSDLKAGVGYVSGIGQLGVFREAACAAALLERDPPSSCLRWLDQLDPELLPRGRVILRPSSVAQTVAQLCEMAGTPRGAERDWLEADIAELADAFASLMDTRYLRLRLDVISTNACRRFHVDAIRGRLVCTYRGTGTQYGLSVAGQDPAHAFTVPTGSPILLRGTLWPPQPSSGLLHRSPPIEGTGETRLVLVLDAVDEPDEEI